MLHAYFITSTASDLPAFFVYAGNHEDAVKALASVTVFYYKEKGLKLPQRPTHMTLYGQHCYLVSCLGFVFPHTVSAFELDDEEMAGLDESMPQSAIPFSVLKDHLPGFVDMRCDPPRMFDLREKDGSIPRKETRYASIIFDHDYNMVAAAFVDPDLQNARLRAVGRCRQMIKDHITRIVERGNVPDPALQRILEMPDTEILDGPAGVNWSIFSYPVEE